MCSWCWGFSSNIEKLKQTFPESNIQIVLTPFRIDTNQPMDKALRDYVMGQWRNVHKTTGQSFNFNFLMPEEFIYNTTLACLSIKAFCNQLPSQEIEYLHAIQHAFYAENKDLTDINVLASIAEKFSIEEQSFVEDLRCNVMLQQLERDFDFCEQLEVQSYPTLMTKDDSSYTKLASGYASFEDLLAKVNADMVS